MWGLDKWAKRLSSFVGDYSGNVGVDAMELTNAWINQFPKSSRVPLLRALTETLYRTYIWKDDAPCYFSESVSNAEFWRNAHICRGAIRGKSHALATQMVTAELSDRFDGITTPSETNQWHNAKNHVFIDDAIFTGSRVIEDYGQWWQNRPALTRRTPQDGPLHIYFWTYLRHTSGEANIRDWFESKLRAGGYSFDITFVSKETLEDRDDFREVSDVLWPSVMTEKAGSSRLHLASRHDLLRNPGIAASAVFPDATQRRLLESELLDASIDISSRLERPWTPLGYGRKPFGFGSLSVSYRNCPNNAPLALWWDLDGWSPLFPRTTYSHQANTRLPSGADVPF